MSVTNQLRHRKQGKVQSRKEVIDIVKEEKKQGKKKMKSVIIGLILGSALLATTWLFIVKEESSLTSPNSSSLISSLSSSGGSTGNLRHVELENSQYDLNEGDLKLLKEFITMKEKQAMSNEGEGDLSMEKKVSDLGSLLKELENKKKEEEEEEGKPKNDQSKKQEQSSSKEEELEELDEKAEDNIHDDLTACSKFEESIEKNPPEFQSQARRYEMVRLGISDFCEKDKTDLSVFFAWEGKGPCTEEASSKALVKFWPTSNVDKALVVRSELVGCFGDKFQRTWRFFAARLSRLEPRQEYRYLLQDEAMMERKFFAPPKSGTEHETHIAILGDTKMPHCKSLFKHTIAKEPEMVIHVGDLTYASNTGSCYGKQHDRDPSKSAPCGYDCTGDVCETAGRMRDGMLLNNIRQWTKEFDAHTKGSLIWMTTMGNHDNDLQWFLHARPTVSAALPGVPRDNLHYKFNDSVEQFSRSGQSIRELQSLAAEYMKQPHFYSFDYGKAHIISIGTEDNPNNAYESYSGIPLSDNLLKRFEMHYGKQSRQYLWLFNDLTKANANRKNVPWIIIYSHRPMYHTASHHPWCGRGGDWYACNFRDTYEPLYKQFGVDLVLSGHSHHYSRSKPMYREEVDEDKGAIHVTIGTGGYDLEGGFRAPPKWIAHRRADRFGMARMIVYNATHASWQFFSPKKVDGKEDSTDEVDILDETWFVRRESNF